MIFHEDSCVSLDIDSSDDWEGRGGGSYQSVCTNKQTNKLYRPASLYTAHAS